MRFVRVSNHVVNLDHVRHVELTRSEADRHGVWFVFTNGAVLNVFVARAEEGTAVLEAIAAA